MRFTVALFLFVCVANAYAHGRSSLHRFRERRSAQRHNLQSLTGATDVARTDVALTTDEKAFVDCAFKKEYAFSMTHPCSALCYNKCYHANSDKVVTNYGDYDKATYISKLKAFIADSELASWPLKSWDKYDIDGDVIDDAAAITSSTTDEQFADYLTRGFIQSGKARSARASSTLPYRVTIQIGKNTNAVNRTEALFKVLKAGILAASPAWYKIDVPRQIRADSIIFQFELSKEAMSRTFTTLTTALAATDVEFGTFLPPFQYLGAGSAKGKASCADYQAGESFGTKLCQTACQNVDFEMFDTRGRSRDFDAILAAAKESFPTKWKQGGNSIGNAWDFDDPTWPKITINVQARRRDYDYSSIARSQSALKRN